MTAHDDHSPRNSEPVWLTAESCALDDFAALTARVADPADTPFATEVQKNVPIYDGASARQAAARPATRAALLAEWVIVLGDGPGVFAIRGAVPDMGVLDAVTAEFFAMIAEEKAAGTSGGDHFAKPGANDRVWNALEKLCVRAPELFAAYYASEPIALACEAWLGPAYQVTSQVNCVNPGGAAQSPHRDYHLGFQSAAAIERYPAHVQRLSPVLTLQGAVAHCDMPIESGPTQLLPFSQGYGPGYLAMARPDFAALFAARCVQLPLAKGDAVFFNPALFHAAGENRTTDRRRIADLLQISSAFGRAMESVDRTRMCKALYPAVGRMLAAGRLTPGEAAAAIAACAEGYSFPTNLDRDPPLGGMAPKTQQALFHEALREGWTPAAFEAALQKQAWRKLT